MGVGNAYPLCDVALGQSGPDATVVELATGWVEDTPLVVSLSNRKVGIGLFAAGGTPCEKEHVMTGGVRLGAVGGAPSENNVFITGGVRPGGGIPSEKDQVITGGVRVGFRRSLALLVIVTVLCWVSVVLIVVVEVDSISADPSL